MTVRLFSVVGSAALMALAALVGVAPADASTPSIRARNGAVAVTGTNESDQIWITQLDDFETGPTSSYRIDVNGSVSEVVITRSLTIISHGGDDSVRFGAQRLTEVADPLPAGPIGRVVVNLGSGNDELTLPTGDGVPGIDIAGDLIVIGGDGDDSATIGTELYDLSQLGPRIGRNLVFNGGRGENVLQFGVRAEVEGRTTITSSNRDRITVHGRGAAVNDLLIRGGTVEVSLGPGFGVLGRAQIRGGRHDDRVYLISTFFGPETLMQFDGGAGDDVFSVGVETGWPVPREPGIGAFLVRLGAGDDVATMFDTSLLDTDRFDGGPGSDRFLLNRGEDAGARIQRFEQIDIEP